MPRIEERQFAEEGSRAHAVNPYAIAPDRGIPTDDYEEFPQPGSLVTVSGSPALALMLVVSAAILRNSPLVHPENTGTPFSVSTR